MAVELLLPSNIGRPLTIAEADQNFSNLEWQLGEPPIINGSLPPHQFIGTIFPFILDNFDGGAYYTSSPLIETWNGDNDFNYTVDTTAIFKFYVYEAGRLPKSTEMMFYAHYDLNIPIVTAPDTVLDMSDAGSGWWTPSGATHVIGEITYESDFTKYSIQTRQIVVETQQSSIPINTHYSTLSSVFFSGVYTNPYGIPTPDQYMTGLYAGGLAENITASSFVSDDRRNVLDIFGDGSCNHLWTMRGSHATIMYDEGSTSNNFTFVNGGGTGSLYARTCYDSDYYRYHDEFREWNFHGYEGDECFSDLDFPYGGASWTISFLGYHQNGALYFVTDGDWDRANFNIGDDWDSVRYGLSIIAVADDGTNGAGLRLSYHKGSWQSPAIYGTMKYTKWCSFIISYNSTTDLLKVYIEGELKYSVTQGLNISSSLQMSLLDKNNGTYGGMSNLRLINRDVTDADALILANECQTRVDLASPSPIQALYYGRVPTATINGSLAPLTYTTISGGLRFTNNDIIQIGDTLSLKVSCLASDGTQTNIKGVSIDTDTYDE